MKKLILLVLIFAVTTLLIISKETEKELIVEIAIENSKKIRPQNWEYVKDRLFDGQTEDVYKITGPILIKLKGATKSDSIAIESIKNELKALLPHKTVDYYENFTGITEGAEVNADFLNKGYHGIPFYKLQQFVLTLNFKKPEKHFVDDAFITTVLSDGSIIKREPRFRENKRISITSESVFFSFNTNLSLEKRKTYIQYELYRWLCFINPKKEYPISYNNSNKGIFTTPDFTPENTKLNDLDTFLLQKLYADDFLEQFKGYLYENYPWRYASYFLNNNKAKLKAYLLVVVLGFFIFLLVFRPLYEKKYKYTYLNYFLPVLIIMLSLINLQYIYKHIISLNSKTTWSSISYSYPFVVVLAIGISLFLWLVEKFMINKVKNFGIQLTFKVLFTFFAFNLPAILFVFSESNDKPGFSEFYLPVLIFTIILAVSRGAIIYLKHYSEALVKEKDIELSHLRELKTQAELKSLHSQINPHFLYNSLNSIAGLAHTNADKTEQMALSLSDLFKYTINRKGKKESTVLDEVTMVQNYLEIEQIRFGERLKFTINVNDDLKDEKIPMFIIQPLVENAVKHGISKIEDQGEIIITIKKVNESIEISVTDNGPDFPEGLVSGYGLQSVYDLLKLSYGNKATLKWQNTPKKSITISIKNK